MVLVGLDRRRHLSRTVCRRSDCPESGRAAAAVYRAAAEDVFRADDRARGRVNRHLEGGAVISRNFRDPI